MVNPVIIVLAYVIDITIGDPKRLPHPVIFIGNSITFFERTIRKFFKHRLRLAGFLFPLVIVLGTFISAWFFLELIERVHPWLKIIAEIWLISTTVAIKGLKQAGLEIYKHLKDNNLGKARFALSMVVGRDTDTLSKSEIARGGIETVAENIVDAVTAPFFYAMIGGAPLALAYRATNTLDSMIGYKNEKYKDLGYASAKLDDILNYIPARLTAIVLLISFCILRLNVRGAFQMILRDAKKHPSPNSGIPESAVAGALDIQLGGRNEYKGVVSHRAKMGDPINPISEKHIVATIKLLEVASFLFVVCYVVLMLVIL